MAFIGGGRRTAAENACPGWVVRLVVEDVRPVSGEPDFAAYASGRWFQRSGAPTIPLLIAAHKAELKAALRRAGFSEADAEAELAAKSKWFA
jgi:hypothetical protein